MTGTLSSSALCSTTSFAVGRRNPDSSTSSSLSVSHQDSGMVCCLSRVSGFRFQISGLFSIFGFQISGFKCQVLGFRFQVWLQFQISDFSFQVLGFGTRGSGSGWNNLLSRKRKTCATRESFQSGPKKSHLCLKTLPCSFPPYPTMSAPPHPPPSPSPSSAPSSTHA